MVRVGDDFGVGVGRRRGLRGGQPENSLGGLPVAGDGPLRGGQPDPVRAHRGAQRVLDLVLRVGDPAAVILRPQVLHRPRRAADLQRDQVVFLVVVQPLVPVAVLGDLLPLEVLGVALRRPHRRGPALHADGAADVSLGDPGVARPGRAVPVRQPVNAVAVQCRPGGQRRGGGRHAGAVRRRRPGRRAARQRHRRRCDHDRDPLHPRSPCPYPGGSFWHLVPPPATRISPAEARAPAPAYPTTTTFGPLSPSARRLARPRASSPLSSATSSGPRSRPPFCQCRPVISNVTSS